MSNAKHIGTATGKLEIVERMRNSTNGNPRFLVSVGDTLLRTKPDSAYAYGIENDVGHDVTANIISYFGHATLADYERT